MPKYLVLHPITPGAEDGVVQPEVLPGEEIELSEEDAEYLVQEGVIEEPKLYKERQAASAEEKRAQAEELRKEADALDKEAKKVKGSASPAKENGE